MTPHSYHTQLPADYTRCHDDGCPERRTCRRWLARNTLDPDTPHAESLHPSGGPDYLEECGERISLLEDLR